MSFRDLRGYLLSHHFPKDYHRCLSFSLFGKKHFICTRCLGWYIAFFLFWPLSVSGLLNLIKYNPLFLYLLPLPALADWTLHRFGIYEGTNYSRFFTGTLLGLSFGMLLNSFISNIFDPNFWIISICYTFYVAIIMKRTNPNR